jgi:hypothetical protein
MAQKKSFYENEYTKQLEEAVFDQKGYDEKKNEQKKKVQAENQRHKGLVRVFFFLCVLGVAVISMHMINLDRDNAAPITVFITLMVVVGLFVRWLNK